MMKTPALWTIVRRSRLVALGLLVAVPGFLAGCDDDDQGSTGPDENNPPRASFTVSPGTVPADDDHQTVVTLDGSESSDPDGDPLSFQWTVPSGRFVNGTDQSSQVAQVTFPGAAPYTVTLRVSDGRGGEDQVSLAVDVGG